MNVKELFVKHENEFLNYKADPSLEDKVHDFVVFESLVKFVKRGDLIGNLGHEEIYLNVDVDEVISVLSEGDLVKLIRCGLRYSDEDECFVMFT